mgnify:CR=1 FL=1
MIRSHFAAQILTNSAVSHCYQGKHKPHPETEVEVECVDAVDGDEAENGGQVAEHLQREEEQDAYVTLTRKRSGSNAQLPRSALSS